MEAKTVEIRDHSTFIPALAVRMSIDPGDDDARSYLLRRCGYSWDWDAAKVILLTHLAGDRVAHCDPYDWGDRTWKTAHAWIVDNWDSIPDGGVVDVRFILGEKPAPAESERTAYPLA